MLRGGLDSFEHILRPKSPPGHTDKITLSRLFVLFPGKSAKSAVGFAPFRIGEQQIYATEFGVPIKPPLNETQGHGRSQRKPYVFRAFTRLHRI
jgi:hypothetical protein